MCAAVPPDFSDPVRFARDGHPYEAGAVLRRNAPWDFVEEVAAEYPLAVILERLGLPAAEAPRILRWSNAVVGALDPEIAGGASPLDVIEEARLGLFDTFARHVAQRRRRPGGDLVSLLVAARVELGGARHARADRASGRLRPPGRGAGAARHRRRRDRALDVADRVLRAHRGARRRAARTAHPRRRPARALPSLREPRRDRLPGRGRLRPGARSELCMGANLARLELRLLFRELAERMPRLVLAGPVLRLRSHFVGGVQHLPVRFASAEGG